MSNHITISDQYIKLEDIFKYFNDDLKLSLEDSAVKAINKNRIYLEEKLKNSDALIYGINTGFGSLCDVRISPEDIEKLQEKLILSHACGAGDEVPTFIAKLIQLLKIKNLSFGYSGVRIDLVETMIAHFNAGIVPVIYQLGSLGASGDLAPLSHMSLPLLGEGEVYYEGQKMESEEALKASNIQAIKLKAKEGLALINGTQFSLAYGLYAVYHAKRLMKLANLTACASIEAFNGMLDPYHHLLQDIRIQKGQQEVAKSIYDTIHESEILKSEKYQVQDPYSFRCIPQVHGSTYDAIEYVSKIVELELNSVTDNPNIFDDEDAILSGGNFHAQALALPLDFLSMALSELADISERRLFKLINGERELPEFLTKHPGLNSGFMIVQYTAASIVNQNKHLANPVSTDSIVSSKGQEDHVSMAANAATKLYRLVDNIYRVISYELMAAAQALEFRKPKKASPKIEQLIKDFRAQVSPLEEDRALYKDMQKAFEFCKSYPL